MLIPTKHENLRNNSFVIGADIITILKRKPRNVEDLFQSLRRKKDVSLEKFYDVLTLLWITGYIRVYNEQINLNNN